MIRKYNNPNEDNVNSNSRMNIDLNNWQSASRSIRYKNKSKYKNKNKNRNRNINNKTDIICKYCKSEDHIIDNCPIIICKICNEKGHVAWKCKNKSKSYTRKKRTKLIDNTSKMEYIEEHSSTITPTSVTITTENTIINNNKNITIQNKKILSKLKNSNVQINIIDDDKYLNNRYSNNKSNKPLLWRQSSQIEYKSELSPKSKPLIDLTKYINSSVIWSEL